MKLMKYTFRTPLFGSIQCEELLSDTDGCIDLSPSQMYGMYNKGEELLMFLTQNMENLSYCVPEELEDVILCAEFGECSILGCKMWLLTHIYTEHSLTEEGTARIREWISGQMSDGWGEGLEQRAWKTDRVKKPVLYFDELTLEFEEDEEMCEVSYYVHPWSPDEFYIYLDNCEEVEKETEFEVVATMTLPHHQRQVIKLSNGFALKMFLKDSGQAELAQTIEDSHPMPRYSVYLVRDMDGPSGVEILPKWVCQSGAFCAYYEMGVDEEVNGTQMPVSRAVWALLE